MKHTSLKLAGTALAIAATAFTARADFTLTPNVSAYGYVSALAGFNQYGSNGVNSDTSLDVNAAKLGFALNFAPVTAKISIYNTPDSGIDLLEANFTYDIGQGWSFTGGRFQSWLGYEPFDVPNCNFITNGAADMSNLIPNFHNGVHIDYAFAKNTVGVAVVDSIYNNDINRYATDSGYDSITSYKPYRGDGKLSDGYGVEAHYGYDDGSLSIGVTAAYQNTRPSTDNTNVAYLYTHRNIYIGDIWAQYIIAQKTTIAAEFYYKSSKDDIWPDRTEYYGLVSVKQQITDQFSLAARFSTGNSKWDYTGSGNANFWKVSVTPAFAVTKNLVIAGEINFANYNDNWKNTIGNGKSSNTFAGVLACFHF